MRISRNAEGVHCQKKVGIENYSNVTYSENLRQLNFRLGK